MGISSTAIDIFEFDTKSSVKIIYSNIKL